MEQRIYHYPSVDSTNLVCRRLAEENIPSGTVVIADYQTAGRGRLGRRFESPGGLGLYLSILWRPECTPEKLLPLTALAAVATAQAVEKACGIRCAIKWPNDIVLHGKKLAGILTESALGQNGAVEYVIAGIGINVAQTPADFSPEVAAIATSLRQELGQEVSRKTLTNALIAQLDTLYTEILPQPQKWLADYRALCLNIGQTVQIIRPGGDCQRAQAIAIDEQFGLVVQHPDGKSETLRSGEVSVRGLYGYAE